MRQRSPVRQTGTGTGQAGMERGRTFRHQSRPTEKQNHTGCADERDSSDATSRRMDRAAGGGWCPRRPDQHVARGFERATVTRSRDSTGRSGRGLQAHRIGIVVRLRADADPKRGASIGNGNGGGFGVGDAITYDRRVICLGSLICQDLCMDTASSI